MVSVKELVMKTTIPFLLFTCILLGCKEPFNENGKLYKGELFLKLIDFAPENRISGSNDIDISEELSENQKYFKDLHELLKKEGIFLRKEAW